jgi:2,3-bisphosphoglycerate-dependent phosphoglycerate mutase
VSDVHCPARIIVARHAEAAYEGEGTGTSGGSLTARGREQAVGLGERLASERVAAVMCSELSRAVQTAELAAGVLSLPVTVRGGLQEFDVGDERGRVYDAGVFDPVMAAWREGDLSAAVPGGESGRQTVDRVLGLLDSVADEFRGETVLAVSHGGVILSLLGCLRAPTPTDPALLTDVPDASLYVFERDADGWRIGEPVSPAGRGE